MLFEILILFEIVAFLFLGLGLIPFNSQENKKNPYLNKLILIFISGIIFFALGIWAVEYDYVYCYIDESVTDFETNTVTSTAMCESHKIESIDISYLNLGMGLVTIILFIILILFASLSKYDNTSDDEYNY